MPSDQAPRPTVDQALLHSLLGRILMVTDKTHLASRSLQAVQLLLPAGGDETRRAALAGKINAIIGTLPDAANAVIVHKAAEACVQLLSQLSPDREATAAFTAKAIHATQPIVAPAGAKPATLLASAAMPGAAAHGPAGHHPSGGAAAGHTAAGGPKGKTARRPPPKHQDSGKSSLPWIILVLLVLGGGGGMIYMLQEPKSEPAKRPLVQQIEAAAKGSVPASNLFGGQIRVGSQNGHLQVTVSGIPAGECVSAGWDLTRTGVLTVNGVLPVRVSAAILNELCHNDDPATMIWSPKPPAEPAH